MPRGAGSYPRSVSASSRSRSFTLTEIIVVIACLLVLMGIAVPVFLNQRGGAQDAQPKAAVTNSLHSARAGAAAVGDYTTEDELLEQLRADNPQLTFVNCDGPSDPAYALPCPGIDLSPTTVYVDLRGDGASGNEVTLCSLSLSGRFFCLRSNEPGNLQGIIEDSLDN